MSTKFFVTKDPTSIGPHLTLSDFVLEMTAVEHARYVVGCGIARYELENHCVHFSRKDADDDVRGRLANITSCLDKVFAELNGAKEQEVVCHDRVTVAETLSKAQLWAVLRGKAELPEVMDMVRQDIEVGDLGVGESQVIVSALNAAKATASRNL